MATSYCFTPFRLPAVRLTLLNSCGVVSTSSCSSISSNGIVTVEQTATIEDRVEAFEKNGDGTFCVQDEVPPILKFIDLTLTFCNVDPELVNFGTGQALVLDDADTPTAIGNIVKQGDAATVNFAFEGWTRLANQADCTTPKYGYALWPWLIDGMMSDITYSAGTANFVMTCRTKMGGAWGVGPYSVFASQATATLGNPMPLLTAVGATEHKRFFVTALAPPTGACGCISTALTMTAPTAVGLAVTLTLPAGTAPAYIDWGDLSHTTSAAGPTSAHTYALAGTYIITLKPRSYSSATYTTSVTVS